MNGLLQEPLREENFHTDGEMILFYTTMEIDLALTSEHMYRLDHPTEGLGILMLHELHSHCFGHQLTLREGEVTQANLQANLAAQ
uniref:Uncharacterized protein n=1 Tax=Arundo donax TaxID=35708 RepID=A0A0A9D4D6_ARUDO